MKLLLKSNDPVTISWVRALLSDAGVESVVLDTNASIVEGSIGAIPRRVMVIDEDLAAARRILQDANIDFTDE